MQTSFQALITDHIRHVYRDAPASVQLAAVRRNMGWEVDPEVEHAAVRETDPTLPETYNELPPEHRQHDAEIQGRIACYREGMVLGMALLQPAVETLAGVLHRLHPLAGETQQEVLTSSLDGFCTATLAQLSEGLGIPDFMRDETGVALSALLNTTITAAFQPEN